MLAKVLFVFTGTAAAVTAGIQAFQAQPSGMAEGGPERISIAGAVIAATVASIYQVIALGPGRTGGRRRMMAMVVAAITALVTAKAAGGSLLYRFGAAVLLVITEHNRNHSYEVVRIVEWFRQAGCLSKASVEGRRSSPESS